MHQPDPTTRAHLTRFALDRLLADEHQGTTPLRTHLAACEHCRRRYVTRTAEQRAHTCDAAARARVDTLLAALATLRTQSRWHQHWLRWRWWLALAVAAGRLGSCPRLPDVSDAGSHATIPYPGFAADACGPAHGSANTSACTACVPCLRRAPGES
jgi:hypothetical protein